MLNLKFNKKIQDITTNNYEANYNKIKQEYHKQTRNVVNKLKLLPKDSFTNEKILDIIPILSDFPPLNAVDHRCALVNRLITDYFFSLLSMQKLNKRSLSNNHHERFNLLLENVEYYLELSKNTNFKSGLPNHSKKIESPKKIAQIKKDNENIILLDEIDESILDDNLYNFIREKLDYISSNGILENRDIDLIQESLDSEIFHKYEQLPDFDFDEACNSINNSIKTSEWFLKNEGKIPEDSKHDLLCCFLNKVEKINKETIPLEHDFYSFIDENDKSTLLDILHQFIDINNYHAGMHIRLALTVASHNKSIHQLKSKIFSFAEYLGEKYFYSRFFFTVDSANKSTSDFLSAFNKLILDVFEPFAETSFSWGLVLAFGDAVFWFVLLNSVYGGTSIFDNNSVKPHSQKMLMQDSTQHQQVIWKFYGDNPILCKQLINEYETTFFLGNIDLRFKKNILKPHSHHQFDSVLASISNDLREMRRLLIKNYNPINSIIELDLQLSKPEQIAFGVTSDKIYALWQWETYGDGLGRICLGFDKEDMIQQASKTYRRDAQYRKVLRVNWDGKISPLETPWITADKMPLLCYDCPIDFNFHIMHKFHELFYDWYANATQKIKSRKIETHINHSLEKENDTLVFDEIDEISIIINESLNNLQSLEDSTIKGDTEECLDKANRINTFYFNQGIKSKRFFKILEENFNIIIKQGKGSEIKVIKQGGKIYRLGHHGKEVFYHANLIRKVLRRLEIQLDDWLKVINNYTLSSA